MQPIPTCYLPIPLNPEKWEDVPGYEGVYQISSLFRVRSMDKVIKCGYGKQREVKGRLLTTKCKNRYNVIAMWRNNKSKRVFMHVLVAKKYHPNPENKPEVNHINGKKNNFHPLNLEWVTHSENMQHAYDTGLIKHKSRVGANNSNAKLNQDKANVIRDLFKTNLFTKVMLSKMFCIDPSCITDIIKYKRWLA